jgi:hypothetical protein
MEKNHFFLFIVVSVIFIFSISCNKYVNSEKHIQSNENIISADGTIVYIKLEGGFFGIITDDGNKYLPVDLPKEFQKDGLKVTFEAKFRPDLSGIHMWGKLIEITKIKK